MAELTKPVLGKLLCKRRRGVEPQEASYELAVLLYKKSPGTKPGQVQQGGGDVTRSPAGTWDPVIKEGGLWSPELYYATNL